MHDFDNSRPFTGSHQIRKGGTMRRDDCFRGANSLQLVGKGQLLETENLESRRNESGFNVRLVSESALRRPSTRDVDSAVVLFGLWQPGNNGGPQSPKVARTDETGKRQLGNENA